VKTPLAVVRIARIRRSDAANAKDAIHRGRIVPHAGRSDAPNAVGRFFITVRYSVGSTSNVNSVDVTRAANHHDGQRAFDFCAVEPQHEQRQESQNGS
jgi:hypothetical protein